MPHVVLLGDSIFDNARYVPDGWPVIRRLNVELPAGWEATLCARDGDQTAHVVEQLAKVPADSTHLVVSVGGNDALGAAALLSEPAGTVAAALEKLARVLEAFAAEYRRMLAAVRALGKPVAVCTIYDAVPRLGFAERTALNGFNGVILLAAARAGVPVIDLRLFCTEGSDYSALSPIEPSDQGGRKIARRVVEVVTGHDFASGRTAVYGA